MRGRGRERERKREYENESSVFHPLIPSPNGWNSFSEPDFNGEPGTQFGS